MADHWNEFDQVFRTKLKDYGTPPPDSVWQNIDAERSFGHIVANRIEQYWRMFGTMILLLIGGGISLSLYLGNDQAGKKTAIYQPISLSPQKIAGSEEIVYTNRKNFPKLSNWKNNTNPGITSSGSLMTEEADFGVEHSDLLASTSGIGFGKPNIKDERLASLIDQYDQWENARPFSFVRYYHMNSLPLAGISPVILVKSHKLPEEEWDYVMPKVEKKTFRERGSLVFTFTPQSIQKSFTPEFNLSSSYVKKRMEMENTRLAYTLGASLQYELKNHKFFESGLNFTQIYEEVYFQNEKRFSNQYDFVEIPFLFGYKNRDAKWGWEFKGGLGLQVLNNYKGYILKKVEMVDVPLSPQPTANNEMYRMSKSDAVSNMIKNDHKLSEKQERSEVLDLESGENPYLTTGVVNVHLAAGVSYYHSIRTSFIVMPYYRRSINSITKESALFKEHFNYMGMSFGTRVKF
jgi:hypothetical protein